MNTHSDQRTSHIAYPAHVTSIAISAIHVAVLTLVIVAGMAVPGYAQNRPKYDPTHKTDATHKPPEPVNNGDGPNDKQAAALRVLSEIKGRVIWASKEKGNFDIVSANFDMTDRKVLTDAKEDDVTPRFSPDGTLIVFARGAAGKFDLYIMKPDGSQQRLLVKDGSQADWAPNGKSVVFVRKNKVMRYDIADRRETLVFDGSAKWFGGLAPLSPSIDRLGKQVVVGTVNDKIEEVRLVSLDVNSEKVTFTHPGFDPALSDSGDDNQFIYWCAVENSTADPRSPQTVHVHQHYIKSGADKKMLDIPGDLSCEMTPRIVRGTLRMLLTVSRGKQSPDQPDSEIYLWSLGSSPAAAVRLTFNRFADAWPDGHIELPPPTPDKP